MLHYFNKLLLNIIIAIVILCVFNCNTKCFQLSVTGWVTGVGLVHATLITTTWLQLALVLLTLPNMETQKQQSVDVSRKRKQYLFIDCFAYTITMHPTTSHKHCVRYLYKMYTVLNTNYDHKTFLIFQFKKNQR